MRKIITVFFFLSLPLFMSSCSIFDDCGCPGQGHKITNTSANSFEQLPENTARASSDSEIEE